MKVLNIMTSNLDYNGIGMSLLNYYNNLDDKNIQMDYLVPNKVDENLKKEFTKKKNKLFELDYKGKKMHQKRPLMYCLKLFKIIRQEKYDIVHAHGSSSLLFMQLITAKLAGVKVRIAHSRNTSCDHLKLHYIFRPIFNLSYNYAFSCGKEAGEWLFGKKSKFEIIANGKDFNTFSFKEDVRKKMREKYNLKSKKVVGHIGNFNYQKNHDFLIDVFNDLKKIDSSYYLMLAGDGPLMNQIKDKVKRYNLEDSVLFLGQLPNNEVSFLLNAMDIMVFPSHFEGFPNVLIEWQMNGLNCVISDSITPDVKITNLVTFKSLNSSSNEWAKVIEEIISIKYKRDEENIENNINDAGYNIKINGKKLADLYNKYYGEKYELRKY